MNTQRAAEVGPPTFDDFDVLRETLLLLAHEPDALVRPIQDDTGLFIKIERLYADLDFLFWPPLTICLSSMLRITPGGNRMLVSYRELAHNSTTENSSLNHNYFFTVEDGELVEFAQSIRACPEIDSPRQDILTNQQMNEADRGAKILKHGLGDQLEASAGDCGVLFERMLGFVDC